MTPLSVLWIGLAERDEFHPLRDWLTQSGNALSMQFAPTVSAAPEVVATSSPPDMVIMSESWPDEFAASDVTQLLTLAPLARTVCITGAWSESVGRTRSHWPPAWRVPLWDAIPRLKRELAALHACRNGVPAVAVDFPPTTASRQETWQWQQGSVFSMPVEPTLRLRVNLREISDPAYTAWLAEELQTAGHTITTEAADVALLDVEPWSAVMAAHVEAAMAQHPNAIPIAITGWLTPELRRELQSLGVVHVADKLSSTSLLNVMTTISNTRRAGGGHSPR